MGWEIAIVLSLVGVAFSLFYMGSNLQNDHYALKLLFLFLGLFLLIANLGLLPLIISANSGTIGAGIATDLENAVNTTYYGLLWGTIFCIAYMMIYFFRQIASGMSDGK